jgi:hypothetical protein
MVANNHRERWFGHRIGWQARWDQARLGGDNPSTTHTITRTPALAALPSVIGGPVPDFTTMDQRQLSRSPCVSALQLRDGVFALPSLFASRMLRNGGAEVPLYHLDHSL